MFRGQAKCFVLKLWVVVVQVIIALITVSNLTLAIADYLHSEMNLASDPSGWYTLPLLEFSVSYLEKILCFVSYAATFSVC